jgi:hypothetical protein
LIKRYEKLVAAHCNHVPPLAAGVKALPDGKASRSHSQALWRFLGSVGHWRAWSEKGWQWLVRCKGGSTVRFEGWRQKLQAIAEQLSYAAVREVTCKGRDGVQWVAGTEVVVTRKAKPKRLAAQGKRVAVKGKPLTVRGVVSRVYDTDGQLLAEWYLLSNVPSAVPDERIALWYYYRWQIESYFKLLKEAGHQLENWEQESGAAIMKRLLLAAQACVLAWRLMRDVGAFSRRTREFQVRLSGRQIKRNRPITAPALLDGLFKLFMMLETLNEYSVDDLKAFANFAFPRKVYT